MCKKIVIIGAGGHGKVIADIISRSKDEVYGFLDDSIPTGTVIAGIPQFKVIGKIKECIEIAKENPNIQFIIAIGNNKIREQIANEYKLNYYIAIHPTSIIGIDVVIEEGTVIMANAVINPSTKIEKHSIINTGAIIEHDNVIEQYVHISPNATLCGTVRIGKRTHIGASATIKNNTTICEDCIIGAGAVVVKDIKESGTYVGIPVKKI